MSFQEACAFLGIEQEWKPTSIWNRTIKRPDASRWEPIRPEEPAGTWQEKARSFLDLSIKALWESPTVLQWLQTDRFLSLETIRTFRLGWNPKKVFKPRESWSLPEKIKDGKPVKVLCLPIGLVIPTGNLDRLKIRQPEGEPKYYFVPGGSNKTFTIGDKPDFVIVESELDAILLSQEAGDLVSCVALGSAGNRPDEETTDRLKKAGSILIALDADEAGAKAAWQFWKEAFPKAERWPVLDGKDPTEAKANGLDLRLWIEAGLPQRPKATDNQLQQLPQGNLEPFPLDWLERFDEETLERLAIMTVDGGLSDAEALETIGA